MSKFTRLEVLLKVGEQGMIPVVYNPNINLMKGIVKACYDGGVR